MTAKHQSLQEWHAAGGGVPVRFKGKEHLWHKQVEQHLSIGGELAKVAAKAAKAAKPALKAAQEVLPAVEREANLAKFLEKSAVKGRVYHGTNADVNKFDPAKLGGATKARTTGLGFFSTDNELVANRFADSQDGANVMPLYVNIQNPLELGHRTVKERSSGKDPFIAMQEAITKIAGKKSWNDVTPEDVAAWKDRLVNRGYDGIVLRKTIMDGAGGATARTIDDPYHDFYIAFEPEQIKSAIGNRGTYDTTKPDLNEAHGGAIHMAGGGDPRKRAMYPKMPTQAIIESPGFDPEVPSDLSRAYARRMADKAEYERSMADQKLTPAQRATAGLEAAGMLGSAMFEGVQQLPKLLDGKEAYEQAVGQGMYKPRFQPEKAAEYAGNVGDFLEQLETKYKMPQILPETLGFAPLAKVAESQAGKAVKQGALTAARAGEQYAEKAVPKIMERGGIGAEMLGAFGQNTKSNVVKGSGGNWLDDSVEKALKPLRKVGRNNTEPAEYLAGLETKYGKEGMNEVLASGMHPMLKEDAAINNWVDRNLTNYVKKQMATPDDPVRKLAEQDITHFPIAQDPSWWERKGSAAREDMGGTQMAKSDLAKQWENRSDAMIQRDTAQEHQDMMHLAPGMYSEKDEWIKKLPPETNLYKAAGDYTPFNARDLGFDHIMDVLKQDVAEGRIRPEQLSKVSMEQAVRRTYEYDQEMAKKMRETAIKNTEGMPLHKEYPEGYKWIELAMTDELPEGWTKQGNVFVSPTGERSLHHPNYVKLNEALDYEGKAMGHCVGSYCPDVASKQSRIYSLRDAKGEPHVTVEVTPGEGVGPKEFFMKDLAPKSLQNDIFALEREGAFNDPRALEDFIEQSPEYKQYKQSLPPTIEQIKGKGNAAPKKDYLPYVQDFVKGGKWSEVRDLQNTGLKPYKGSGDLKYVTPEEYNIELQKELGLLPPEEGMKAGGRVNRKHFHEPHLSVGGDLAKIAAKAAKTAKPAAKAAEKAAEYLPGVHYADPLKPPTMKMSEALGITGSEGKTLNFTETDRSRVFGPNRGGTGFSALQHYSLPHKEAGTVWGWGKDSVATKKLNINDPENTVWTTYAGSPNQHKSNTLVVKDAIKTLQEADKKGAVHPKQIELINDRIREARSQNGGLLFPDSFDITDPEALKYATTFDRRAAISDTLMGLGVKGPMVKKEFKEKYPGVKWEDAANIDAILQRETDPVMLGANTFDVGPHLFSVDNQIITRPDLNEAFPVQATGTDFGVRYELAPMRVAAPDWIKARNIQPNEPINAWAMSRAAPSQFVSEDYLTWLQKQGHKKGGLAQAKKPKKVARHGNTVPN